MTSASLGRAVLDIDTDLSAGHRGLDQFEKDTHQRLGRAADRIDNIGRSLTGMGTLLVGVGAPFAGLAAVATKAASDLEESVNAVNVVFGDASKTIHAFGENSAHNALLARQEFNELASVTGALLTNFGFSQDEAADKTLVLTRRAGDLASVFNTDVSEALFAINAALRGETEPIRRFAADVTDATLEVYALSQGIETSVSEMSQAEKAQLRLGAILEQTAKVEGDLANTRESVANSLKAVQAETTDLAAELGTALLPVVKEVLSTALSLVNTIKDWIAENPELAEQIVQIGGVGGAAALGLGLMLIAVGQIAQGVAGAIRALQAMRLAMLALTATPVGLALTLIAAGIAAVALAIEYHNENQDEGARLAREMADAHATEAEALAATRKELASNAEALDDQNRLIRQLADGERQWYELKPDQRRALRALGATGKETADEWRALIRENQRLAETTMATHDPIDEMADDVERAGLAAAAAAKPVGDLEEGVDLAAGAFDHAGQSAEDYADEAWLAGDRTAGLASATDDARHSADTFTESIDALRDGMGGAKLTAAELALQMAEIRDRATEAGAAIRAAFERTIPRVHHEFSELSDEALTFGDTLDDEVIWSVQATDAALEKMAETSRETGRAVRSAGLSAAEIARNQRQFSEWAPAYQRVQQASRRLARARRQEIQAARQLEAAREAVLAIERRIAGLTAPHTEAATDIRNQLRVLDLQEAEEQLAHARRRQQAQGDEEHLEALDAAFQTFRDQQAFERDELDARLRIETLRADQIEANHAADLEAAQQQVIQAQQRFNDEKAHRAAVVAGLEGELALAQDRLDLINAQHDLENLTRDNTLAALKEEERLTKRILELRERIALAQDTTPPPRSGGGGGGGGSDDDPPDHTAADGQTLGSQTADVQATYRAVHGDRAAQQWARDHNREIGIPGFQHGGRFTVGGLGGIDRNLVMFRASRGETVDVTPAGQQAQGIGGVINLHFYGDNYGLQDLSERVLEGIDLGRRKGSEDALTDE